MMALPSVEETVAWQRCLLDPRTSPVERRRADATLTKLLELPCVWAHGLHLLDGDETLATCGASLIHVALRRGHATALAGLGGGEREFLRGLLDRLAARLMRSRI